MNKKKIIVLALALTLCSASLVSCGGNQENGNSTQETTAKVEQKETEQGAGKGIRRGVQSIADGVKNGVTDGINTVKNGVNTVKNGLTGAKNDVMKGADNINDSIADGSLDTEDATHGIPEKDMAEDGFMPGDRMPRRHRDTVPHGK